MLIDFNQLFPRYKIKPKAVLHIGANKGEEAKVYYQLGIRKVIWIEGNPELMWALNNEIKQYPGQVAFNYCVGEVEEQRKFHIANNGGQSSSVLNLGTHRQEHPDVNYTHSIDVNIRRLDNLFLDGSIPLTSDYDFLNCDLQGFDLEAIKGIGQFLEGFKWVYVEVNQTKVYEGCALQPEVESYLAEFGFKLMETKFLRGCTWGDAIFIKQW